MLKSLIQNELFTVGLSPYKAQLGRNVAVNPKTSVFFHPENIVIGDDVCITGAYINAGAKGKVIIEKCAAIGCFVSIIAVQLNLESSNFLPKFCRKIRIGEGSFIGNNSVIMANVGKGAVVGAGSVVTKDVPDYAVVYGNPAEVRRMGDGCASM